jgi:hypothetical protein
VWASMQQQRRNVSHEVCDTILVLCSDGEDAETCFIDICKESSLHTLLRSHTLSCSPVILHYISLPLTLSSAKHCLQYLSSHLEHFKQNPESTMYHLPRDKIVHIKTLIEMLI